MKKMFFVMKMLKSNYCKITFLASLIITYFLVPEGVLNNNLPIGITFITLSSLVITCLVRNIKERVVSARQTKTTSALGIVAIAVGYTALQACGIGAPICGASIGAGILALILPGTTFKLLSEHYMIIFSASIILQVVALYFMNCFKMIPCKNKTK